MKIKKIEMKKLLLFGLIGALCFGSCKKDENVSNDYNSLGHSVRNLKVLTPKKTSVFDDFAAYLSIPLNKSIEDKESGLTVKIELESVECFHKVDQMTSAKIDGEFTIENDTAIIFNPTSSIILNETYSITYYFKWYKKVNGAWKIFKNGDEDMYRALWAEYTPTIVDGQDIVFGTTKGGENATDIVAYNGDMQIDFKSKLIFADDTTVAGSEKVALRLRRLEVTSNKSDDYSTWEQIIDTANTSVQYNAVIPAPYVHLIPNIYYTINVQLDYMVNEGGKWAFVLNNLGDTITWNYNKSFGTTDLFVPSKIIESLSPNKGKAVAIDSIPMIQMNKTHLIEEEYEGIMFRPVLDTFAIYKNDKEIASTFAWLEKGAKTGITTDSMAATLDPVDNYLLPDASYKIVASAHWEFKTDTTWEKMTVNDNLYNEKVTGNIQTLLNTPGKIVSELFPVTAADEVSLTEKISANLNYSTRDSVIRNGIVFKPVFEELAVMSKNTEGKDTLVSDDLVWASSVLAEIPQEGIYFPYTNYSIKTIAHWEYKNKDGEYIIYNKDGVDVEEVSNASFRTKRAPDKIYNGHNVKIAKHPINQTPTITTSAIKDKLLVEDGIEFMPYVDSIYVSKKVGELGSLVDSVIKHDLVWEDANTVKLNRSSFYDINTIYTINFIAHWEFRRLGSTEWLRHPSSEVINESIHPTFKTVNVPETIVREITPSDSSEVIAIDSMAILTLSYAEGVEVDFGGTKYKVVKDVFSISDTALVASDLTYENDNQRLMLKPQADLVADTKYTIKSRFHWEYQNENQVWIKTPDEFVKQIFTTGSWAEASAPN